MPCDNPREGRDLDKPNILFIFTDEQRADTMACYGNSVINTPNLDRLAAQSVVFENAYVTQPVCTPSRSTIMTGLYPHCNGCTANNIPLDESVPTVAELFSGSDYAFGYHGKWHLGDEVFIQHGFDEWRSIEDMYRRYYSEGRDRRRMSSYSEFLLEEGYEPAHDDDGPFFSRRFAAGLPVEHTKPMYLAQEACRYIRGNAGNRFALYVNFLEPHMPFTGPYDGRRPTDGVPLPENFDTVPDGEPAHCRAIREVLRRQGYGGHDLAGSEGWKRLTGNYWGLVELVDEAVGRILAALSECGLDNETIVVFTSDHGDMMGSHRLLAKCVMYEEAVRVPLLIKAPGCEPRRISAPVSQVDLVPTLLDLCGQPPADTLQGCSLRETLERGTDPPGEFVVIEWNGPNRANIVRQDRGIGTAEVMQALEENRGRTVISCDRWKLNINENDLNELYNLNDDPLETRNLFYGSEHEPVKQRLADGLREWQRRTGDNFETAGCL